MCVFSLLPCTYAQQEVRRPRCCVHLVWANTPTLFLVDLFPASLQPLCHFGIRGSRRSGVTQKGCCPVSLWIQAELFEDVQEAFEGRGVRVATTSASCTRKESVPTRRSSVSSERSCLVSKQTPISVHESHLSSMSTSNRWQRRPCTAKCTSGATIDRGGP